MCPPRRARLHDTLKRCAPLIQVVAVLDPPALQHLQQNISAELNAVFRRDVRAAAAELRHGAAADLEASSKFGGGDYSLSKERGSSAVAAPRWDALVLKYCVGTHVAGLLVYVQSLPAAERCRQVRPGHVCSSSCQTTLCLGLGMAGLELLPAAVNPAPAQCVDSMHVKHSACRHTMYVVCVCVYSKRMPRISMGSSAGGSDSVSDWTADPLEFTGATATAGTSAAKRAAFLDGEYM